MELGFFHSLFVEKPQSIDPSQIVAKFNSDLDLYHLCIEIP